MAIQLYKFDKPRITRNCPFWQSCKLWHCEMAGTEPGVGSTPEAAFEDWRMSNMHEGLPTNKAMDRYMTILLIVHGIPSV